MVSIVRVRGGALSFVLVIGLLITIFMLLLVFINQATLFAKAKSSVSIQLKLNTTSLSQILSDRAYSSKVDFGVVDLGTSYDDSSFYRISPWGAYESHFYSSFVNGVGHQVNALIGFSNDRNPLPTLSLPSSNLRLSLVGRTLIKGVVEVPQGELYKGRIENRRFSRDTICECNQEKSEPSLPELNDEFTLYLDSMIYNLGHTLSLTSLNPKFNSWGNATYGVRTSFFNDTAKGNIIIFSTQKLWVGKDASLEGCLLVAPSIEFESGFEGKVHAIFKDSCVLNEGARMIYPSSMSGWSRESQPILWMKPKSEIQGAVHLLGFGNTSLLQNSSMVERQSIIEGLFFSMGAIELKGEIKGAVFANRFVHKTSSSLYENHLLDVKIGPARIESLSGMSLLRSSNLRKTASWRESRVTP